MAKPSVHGELAASVRDFKILLYSTDEGAPCANLMVSASFVLQVVLTAMQIEMIRSKDQHDIKAALNESLSMIVNDRFCPTYVPELVRCIDLALKYAGLVKPANLNRAIRTYEATPPTPSILPRPL